jgi:hypothetical protein
MAMATAPRLVGKGRQPREIEDLRDRRDELKAHIDGALTFVDQTAPRARRLQLALEAIAIDDLRARPVFMHLAELAAGLVYDLERYERQHLPPTSDPAVLEAIAA